VECDRSRETVTRSNAAGWAEYGYCASHSRYFWGLRVHLVCTLHGLRVLFRDRGRQGWCARGPAGHAGDRRGRGQCPRQTLIGDKNYFGGGFENELTERNQALLRPVR